MSHVTDKLRPHVQDIIEAVWDGDQTAARIRDLYRMHRDCPGDPAAAALCLATFDEWMKGRPS